MNLRDYFNCSEGYFWKWEENSEVVAIPNGSTIAYREFVAEALAALTPQGIPLFGSLLLAIVATNPNATNDLDAIQDIVDNCVKDKDRWVYSDSFIFLRRLAELPKEYKHGKNRMLLFQAIFDSCHSIASIRDSKLILSDVTLKRSRGADISQSIPLIQGKLDKDFKTISILNRRFPDVNSILQAISSLPEIAEDFLEFEPPIKKDIKGNDLISELIENAETFHVGILVKHIWSGLNIPFHNSLPSQQPIGGVSDLTNKGDFSKLLVSEFANDDVIFLSRLANNEALYLNREVPPVNNNLHRIILIDVSLKNWGTPKTIAYAIMVAIARHPKTDIKCTAFALGNKFYPINFDTVHDLNKSIQILDGCLDPIKGMELFIKQHSTMKNIEVFYLSSPDTFKLPAMQKLMSDHHGFFNYWIQTTAEGKISLFKKQQNSRKHVQDLQLALHEHWKKEPTTNTPQRSKYQVSLPILLRSSQTAISALSTSDGEIFQISSERSLFRFYNKDLKRNEKGWELLADNLPFATKEVEIALLDNGDNVLFMFQAQNKQIFILNLNTGYNKTFKFEEWIASPNRFVFHENKFHYLTKTTNWSIGMDGIITENNTFLNFLLEKMRDREKESKELLLKTTYNSVILKNVQTVFINEVNNLVFNKHELLVNNHGAIKFDLAQFMKVEIVASFSKKNMFVFADGSTIEIKRLGVIILKSSDKQIPPIYIPSVLDGALGIATQNAFCGAEYFYKEPMYNVIIKVVGQNALASIKIIKELTSLELREAKELFDSANQNNVSTVISKNTTERKAIELKTKLEEIGNQIILEPTSSHSEHFERLTPHAFFDQYVNAFITTIKNHATKN